MKLGERRREAAITRLRDLQYTEIELAERRIRLAESLARLDVRAPVDGVVFGSRILAVQSVVRPADAMMYLVPGGQPLEISARIETIDIDQVHPGQSVLLRFTSFDQRSTPEVMGRVARLSADAVTDAATGDTYYEAVILPDAESPCRPGSEPVAGDAGRGVPAYRRPDAAAVSDPAAGQLFRTRFSRRLEVRDCRRHALNTAAFPFQDVARRLNGPASRHRPAKPRRGINWAASDARKVTGPAMSSGRPHRPAGTRAMIAADRSGSSRRGAVLSVAIYPGATALTFTP